MPVYLLWWFLSGLARGVWRLWKTKAWSPLRSSRLSPVMDFFSRLNDLFWSLFEPDADEPDADEPALPTTEPTRDERYKPDRFFHEMNFMTGGRTKRD